MRKAKTLPQMKLRGMKAVPKMRGMNGMSKTMPTDEHPLRKGSPAKGGGKSDVAMLKRAKF